MRLGQIWSLLQKNVRIHRERGYSPKILKNQLVLLLPRVNSSCHIQGQPILSAKMSLCQMSLLFRHMDNTQQCVITYYEPDIQCTNSSTLWFHHYSPWYTNEDTIAQVFRMFLCLWVMQRVSCYSGLDDDSAGLCD